MWSRNRATDLASRPGDSDSIPRLPYMPHAKRVWSLDVLIISSCNRWKALCPSPYNSAILTSNIPSRQYASSSFLVVCRFDAHRNFSATHASANDSDFNCRVDIPVIFSMILTNSSPEPWEASASNNHLPAPLPRCAILD